MMNNVVYVKNRVETTIPILSIIITLRTVRHYNMIERLKYRLIEDNRYLLSKLEFIVVDYGSENCEELKEECFKLGFNYVYLDEKSGNFNAGLARNIGAIYSQGTYICHEDIDLVSCNPSKFYEKLLLEIKTNKLSNDNKKFLSVPVIYLTDEGTQEFFSTPVDNKKSIFIQYLIENNKNKFVFYMPASSVIIVNRYHYLSMGGYNEEFKGWGLEDLEYAFRLTRKADQFHTPMDYKKLVTKPEFSLQYDYIGWRAQFRLHGDLLGAKGIMLFHAHHPIDRTWRNRSKHQGNQDLFEKCIEIYSAKGQYLSPLPYRNIRTLTFGKGCFVYNDVMRPLWGELDIKGYEYFDDISIVDYIKDNCIDLVVFTNPYANEKRLAVYNIIKNNNIPFYVVERGALNDSIFIDKTGFCCESSMYHERYWNKDLSDSDYQKTIEYISHEKSSNATLEKQGGRKSEKQIRKELSIPSFKKIIFVPLQSRSDTTVNYFAGDIGSFDNFISLVNNLKEILPNNWEIVVKKHPLSKIEENITGVKFVDNYHIKDLLELCDYVLLMNSGVGVLATLWNKPVIYTAQAFYASSKLNRKATTAQEVLNIVESGFKPKEDDVIKFISYLINEFYSFGVMKTRLANYTSKSNLTITDGIDIYQLNFEGKNLYKKERTLKKIDYNSVIYSPFKKSIVENILKKKSPVLSTNVSKPIVLKKEPIIKKENELKNNSSKKGGAVRKFRKLMHSPRAFFVDMINNFKKG